MAQNYTEQLRKDNVRDAIYEDLQNNCEVLRTSWSGNEFPDNPKVGQPCYRVDEDKLYYWDGYRWSQKGGGGSAELKSMEIAASESEVSSITLSGARCLNKNMMFVFVDKIAQDPSTYSMNDDGTIVSFTPSIPANAAVTLRWFDTDVGTFDTAVFATDEEFSAGTATNKAPTVKQARSGLVTVDTAQNITGIKTFTNPGISIIIERDTNQQETPTTSTYTTVGLYKNKTFSKGDGFSSWISCGRTQEGYTYTGLSARRFLEGDDTEIVSSLSTQVSATGETYATAPTPNIAISGDIVATCGYINTKFQVVSALPATPDENVFYFIPES